MEETLFEEKELLLKYQAGRRAKEQLRSERWSECVVQSDRLRQD